VADPLRCRACGYHMSVNRVSDLCGMCRLPGSCTPIPPRVDLRISRPAPDEESDE